MTEASSHKHEFEKFNPYNCEYCKNQPTLCHDHLIAFHLGLNTEASEYMIEVNKLYGYYSIQQWLEVYFRQKQGVWEAAKKSFPAQINNYSIWFEAFQLLGFNEAKANEITTQIDDNIFAIHESPYGHASRYIDLEFRYNEILKDILQNHKGKIFSK